MEALKQRIRDEVAQIRPEMLRNVMTNFRTRLEQCLRLNGRHLSDVIFKN